MKKNEKKSRIGSPLFLVIIIIIFTVVTGYWSVHNLIVTPASINKVGTGSERIAPVLRSTSPRPPAGCEYRQVECFREPCEPVLVCNENLPIASTAPAVTARPLPSELAAPSCVPRPICLDAAIPCTVVPPEDGEFCPRIITPTPRPTTSTACIHAVDDLWISSPCGAGAYASIRYQCRNESAVRSLQGCITYSAALAKVDAACKETCGANQ